MSDELEPWQEELKKHMSDVLRAAYEIVYSAEQAAAVVTAAGLAWTSRSRYSAKGSGEIGR